MTPLGYSARDPAAGTGNSLADINSDMAFKGNLAFQGHWSGFRVIDISDPANPTQIYNTEAAGTRRARATSSSTATSSSARGTRPQRPAERERDVRGPASIGHGFEGIHIWDISNPAAAGLQSASCACRDAATTPARRRRLRRAHRDRRAGRRARQPLPLRRRLERHLHGHRHRPDQALRPDRRRRTCAAPTHGRGASCHDNNVLMNVGGTKVGYAMCAGGNGLAMYKFDMAKPADRGGHAREPGRRREPDADLVEADADAAPAYAGHSGSFTYDGKLLIFGHEPGGGTAGVVRGERHDRCSGRCSSSTRRPATIEGTMRAAARRRPATRELHVAQLQRRADVQGLLRACPATTRSGISVFDFTNPAGRAADRLRRPGAEYTPGATNAQPTAATGRRTSTTAASTSPTSVAA